MSNCWCSTMTWELPPAACCMANSSHKAIRAGLDFKALRTAGNVFLASAILFSKMEAIQLRRTSSRLAEFGNLKIKKRDIQDVSIKIRLDANHS